MDSLDTKQNLPSWYALIKSALIGLIFLKGMIFFLFGIISLFLPEPVPIPWGIFIGGILLVLGLLLIPQTGIELKLVQLLVKIKTVIGEYFKILESRLTGLGRLLLVLGGGAATILAAIGIMIIVGCIAAGFEKYIRDTVDPIPLSIIFGSIIIALALKSK